MILKIEGSGRNRISTKLDIHRSTFRLLPEFPFNHKPGEEDSGFGLRTTEPMLRRMEIRNAGNREKVTSGIVNRDAT